VQKLEFQVISSQIVSRSVSERSSV